MTQTMKNGEINNPSEHQMSTSPLPNGELEKEIFDDARKFYDKYYCGEDEHRWMDFQGFLTDVLVKYGDYYKKYWHAAGFKAGIEKAVEILPEDEKITAQEQAMREPVYYEKNGY